MGLQRLSRFFSASLLFQKRSHLEQSVATPWNGLAHTPTGPLGRGWYSRWSNSLSFGLPSQVLLNLKMDLHTKFVGLTTRSSFCLVSGACSTFVVGNFLLSICGFVACMSFSEAEPMPHRFFHFTTEVQSLFSISLI